MKFRVSMKDPDTLHDAIKDAVQESLEEMNLPDDEHEALAEVRFGNIQSTCSKWFKYGEYLTVEVDTDAGTCTVVPNG